MVPKGKHIPVVKATSSRRVSIYGRQPRPHDILAIMGVEALADYYDRRSAGRIVCRA